MALDLLETVWNKTFFMIHIFIYLHHLPKITCLYGFTPNGRKDVDGVSYYYN